MALKLIGSTQVISNSARNTSSVDLSDLEVPDAMNNFIPDELLEDSDELVDTELDTGEDIDDELLSNAESALYTLAVVYSALFPQPTNAQLQALAVALDVPAEAIVSLLESTHDIEESLDADLAELEAIENASLEHEDVDLTEDDLDEILDLEDLGDDLDQTMDALEDLDEADENNDGLEDSLDLSDADLIELDDMLDEPVTSAADGLEDPTSDENDEMKIALNNDGLERNKPNPDDIALMHDGEPEVVSPEPKQPFGANDGEPTLP